MSRADSARGGAKARRSAGNRPRGRPRNHGAAHEPPASRRRATTRASPAAHRAAALSPRLAGLCPEPEGSGPDLWRECVARRPSRVARGDVKRDRSRAGPAGRRLRPPRGRTAFAAEPASAAPDFDEALSCADAAPPTAARFLTSSITAGNLGAPCRRVRLSIVDASTRRRRRNSPIAQAPSAERARQPIWRAAARASGRPRRASAPFCLRAASLR